MRRRQQPAAKAPAQQGFDSNDAGLVEIEDRLVEELELVVLDGSGKGVCVDVTLAGAEQRSFGTRQAAVHPAPLDDGLGDARRLLLAEPGDGL